MAEKGLMLVGIDESEESFYALKWVLNNFITNYSPNYPFNLLLVHAKPNPSSAIGLGGPVIAGSLEVLPYVEAELKKSAVRVVQKAKELCKSNGVDDVRVEVVEGDARKVLCDVVEKHHASLLVVGSHGYGAIKRAVLGSVSDHCAHNAHCSVMIVKKPKLKH
ncbi:hypothetical protein vseg_010499 [Gypsophila vaccaria]